MEGFRIGDLKQEYLEKTREEKERSTYQQRKSVLEKLEEYSSKDARLERRPQKARKEIFEFFEENPAGWSSISPYISALKPYLLYIADQFEEESKAHRNLKMIHDTLKDENFPETDSSSRFEEYSRKILSDEQVGRIKEFGDDESKFTVNLFLDTSAKISVLAALKDKDIAENKVSFRRYYVQGYGEKEVKNLEEHRKRTIELSDETLNLYKKVIEEKSSKFIFGDTAGGSEQNLRRILKRLNSNFDFEISSKILRLTSGYRKINRISKNRLKEEMGLKSNQTIDLLENIAEKRNQLHSTKNE